MKRKPAKRKKPPATREHLDFFIALLNQGKSTVETAPKKLTKENLKHLLDKGSLPLLINIRAAKDGSPVATFELQQVLVTIRYVSKHVRTNILPEKSFKSYFYAPRPDDKTDMYQSGRRLPGSYGANQ